MGKQRKGGKGRKVKGMLNKTDRIKNKKRPPQQLRLEDIYLWEQPATVAVGGGEAGTRVSRIY